MVVTVDARGSPLMRRYTYRGFVPQWDRWGKMVPGTRRVDGYDSACQCGENRSNCTAHKHTHWLAITNTKWHAHTCTNTQQV